MIRLLIAWLAVGGQRDAFASDPPSQIEGVESIQVDAPPCVGLSDMLTVSVVLITRPDVSVEPPTVQLAGSGFELLDVVSHGPDSIQGRSGSLSARRFDLRFEPMRLGRSPIGELRLALHNQGNESISTFELPSVDVIATTPAPEDPMTLRPIPPLPNVSPVTERRTEDSRAISRLLLVIVAVALFTTGIVLAALHRGNPARSAAVQRMRRLRAKAAMDSDGKAMLDRASGILRVYLERTYALRAPRQTTPEFLADPRTSAVLDPAQREALSSWLTGGDAARFGTGSPPASWVDGQLARALSFLEAEPASRPPRARPGT